MRIAALARLAYLIDFGRLRLRLLASLASATALGLGEVVVAVAAASGVMELHTFIDTAIVVPACFVALALSLDGRQIAGVLHIAALLLALVFVLEIVLIAGAAAIGEHIASALARIVVEARLNRTARSGLLRQEAVLGAERLAGIGLRCFGGRLLGSNALRQACLLIDEIVVVAAAAAVVELSASILLDVEVPTSLVVLAIAHLGRLLACVFVCDARRTETNANGISKCQTSDWMQIVCGRICGAGACEVRSLSTSNRRRYLRTTRGHCSSHSSNDT